MIGGDAVDGTTDEPLQKCMTISSTAQRWIHLKPVRSIELVAILLIEREVVRGDLGADALTFFSSLFDQCEAVCSGKVSDVWVDFQRLADGQDRTDRLDLRLGWSPLLVGRAICVTLQDGRILGMEHHQLATEGFEHLGDRRISPRVDISHAGAEVTLPGDVIAERGSAP